MCHQENNLSRDLCCFSHDLGLHQPKIFLTIVPTEAADRQAALTSKARPLCRAASHCNLIHRRSWVVATSLLAESRLRQPPP